MPFATAGRMCQYSNCVRRSRPTIVTTSGRKDSRRTVPSSVAYTGVPFGHEMSMPKWKPLCMPFGVIPIRGSPKNPRTGCWRSKGFTGQPYAGAVLAPAVAGITSAPSWSRAAAAATAAIARRERARSLRRACEVAMRPRSSGPQTGRSRPPHRSPTDAGRPLGGRPWECYKRSMQDFRILGTLEVIGESGPVALGGPRPRALLAALLLRAGHVVPTEQLVDELYGAEPPKIATASLQNSVAALRKALGPDAPRHPRARISSSPSRRSRSMRAASSSCWRTRATALRPERRTLLLRGLALWRGPPLAEFAFEAWAETESETPR